MAENNEIVPPQFDENGKWDGCLDLSVRRPVNSSDWIIALLVVDVGLLRWLCIFTSMVSFLSSSSDFNSKKVSMEEVDIVIVGAGIAGLSTSLGLHRLGIRSLVLESSESLRTTGYALAMWTNAWKALDVLGIGDSLRQQHLLLQGIVVTSAITGVQSSSLPIEPKGESGQHEIRCVKRNVLLETLAKELPGDAIKFSAKVVSIEESGFCKLIHLADGTILITKVLIGCDGVNSIVAKWLGFKKAVFTGRSAIRGVVTFESNHSLEPKFMQFMGDGIRSGVIPCDDHTVYWFFTWIPSKQEREIEDDHAKLKELVLSRLGKMPEEKRKVIEETQLECFTSAPLRYRRPWEVLWGNIYKGNVCVAGDALHPMTPDIGQGGCAALEDGVVLARCLGHAMLKKPEEGGEAKEEYRRIEEGLSNYARERKWRSFELISTAFVVGHVQQSHGKVTKFLRDRVFAGFLAGLLPKRAEYDCGKLTS